MEMEENISVPSASNINLMDDVSATISVNHNSETAKLCSQTILDGRFFEILENNSTADNIVAKCTKCSTEIKGSKCSSSNFIKHMKRKHGIAYFKEYADYLKEKNKKRKNDNVVAKSSYSQDEFEIDIVKYFVDSMISLRCVENIYFHHIIRKISNNSTELKIISRKTLGRKISNFYDSQLVNIHEELKNIDFVCTTIDIWSGRQRSFLGVTAHWIDPDTLKRISRALACHRFEGVHSYERIYYQILKVYENFELNSTKVVAAITDNASNFVKAFKSFGVEEECISDFEENIDLENSSDNYDCSSEGTSNINDEYNLKVDVDESLPLHFRCASHTLNLIATVDANKVLKNQHTELSQMHEQVLEKCNSLWKAANRPKSAEIIKSVLEHTLSRPNVTRWNSLYDAMKQILSVKNLSSNLFKKLNLKNSFKEQDFIYIEEYIKCSKNISEALDILQSEKEMYFGILIPTLLSLKYKLEKIFRENLMYCRPLVEAYLEGIKNRFEDYLNFSSPQAEKAVLATLSHPKFLKFKWQSCITNTNYSKIKSLFVNELSKEIAKEQDIITNISSDQQKRNDFYCIDSNSEEDDNIYPKRKAELIYSHFCLEERQDLSILNNFKEIKKIFMKFNTPLPSSAPVERLFSYATMINYYKANRLSDEMFEQRVVLKANIKYMEE